MRDKQFIINSIKMDLFRVVTAAGNINQQLPIDSVSEFMKHADGDFEKVELSPHEKMLRLQLRELLSKLHGIQDPHTRLRWAEDVLTIRCRI